MGGWDKVYVLNLPWILQWVWNIAKYWIPSKTLNLVDFIPGIDLLNIIHKSQLPEYLHGQNTENIRKVPTGCISIIDPKARDYGAPAKVIDKVMKMYKKELDIADAINAGG